MVQHCNGGSWIGLEVWVKGVQWWPDWDVGKTWMTCRDVVSLVVDFGIGAMADIEVFWKFIYGGYTTLRPIQVVLVFVTDDVWGLR